MWQKRLPGSSLAVLLLVFLICSVSYAEVTSSLYANAGGIITSSKSSWTTSNDLGPGWLSSQVDMYQHGGMTSRVVSNGPTGMKRSETLESSRTDDQMMKVVSTGKVNIHESGGTWSTQTNISPLQCDASGNVLDETTGGRYPETQSSTVFSDLYGTGETTSYESETLVDVKMLGSDVSYEAVDGIAFWDASGKYESGLDWNLTELQYVYTRAERAFIRSMDDTPINASASWLWAMSADEVAEETVANETVSNVTEAAEETEVIEETE